MEFEHIPVMLNETLEGLNVHPGGIYVDGTLGGAGHSGEIARRMQPGGRLVGIDQDQNAIEAAGKRLAEFGEQVSIVHSNFKNIKHVIRELGIKGVDGILLDLGVSSHQLDERNRGFSYMQEGPLDMRMDTSSLLTAADIVNKAPFEEIKHIIKEYGEEKWADRIAKFICEERQKQPIETTSKLVELIRNAIPAAARREGGHPAKRTFQALRIAVNNELGILEQTITDAVDILNPGGRLAIITFHSLEDRIIKTVFNKFERPCTCPPQIPICVCGGVQKLKVITRKPITATEEELEINSRSKSAKLRVAERV